MWPRIWEWCLKRSVIATHFLPWHDPVLFHLQIWLRISCTPVIPSGPSFPPSVPATAVPPRRPLTWLPRRVTTACLGSVPLNWPQSEPASPHGREPFPGLTRASRARSAPSQQRWSHGNCGIAWFLPQSASTPDLSKNVLSQLLW